MLRQLLEPEQYTATRYADRLTDAGALASIGIVGDSYDCAMAESIIGVEATVSAGDVFVLEPGHDAWTVG